MTERERERETEREKEREKQRERERKRGAAVDRFFSFTSKKNIVIKKAFIF